MKAWEIIAFSSSIASLFYGIFRRPEAKIPRIPSDFRVSLDGFQPSMICPAPGLAPTGD